MKQIKCNKCDHVWSYKGDSEYYCTCPRCLYKVKVKQDVKLSEELI